MGTGSFLPEKNVSNTDLEKYVDTSDEWISAEPELRIEESQYMKRLQEWQQRLQRKP